MNIFLKRFTTLLLCVISVTAVFASSVVQASAVVNGNQIGAYKSILREIHDHPYIYLHSGTSSDVEDCSSFALFDIDEDGTEDLVVKLSIGIMASNCLKVWTAYDSGSLTELSEAEKVGHYSEFYKNGYVVARAGHNQTNGFTIWPHTVYHYNSTTRKWDKVYDAYCVDRDLDRTGEYSLSADTDRDGVIYYVNGVAKTKAQYEAYENECVPSKNKLNISWKKLTYGNIGNLSGNSAATPQITSLTSDKNGITVKWDPVAGAAAYRVYYKTSSGDWKRFASDVKGTSKLDTGVKYGRKETYTVRALDDSGNLISGYKSAGWSTVYGVETPQITGLISDEKGITVTWKRVAGASTYRVYYKTASGDWKRFASDVNGTTKLDTGVKYGRAESYTVRAVNNKGEVMSGYRSAGWSTTYGVETPKITKLENISGGIRITWAPVAGASTYRVYYKTSGGGWKRFATDVKGTTKIDTGVKVGRKETYTVRALNNKGEVMSGYVSSGWSITYQK